MTIVPSCIAGSEAQAASNSSNPIGRKRLRLRRKEFPNFSTLQEHYIGKDGNRLAQRFDSGIMLPDAGDKAAIRVQAVF
ncbi:hypothetical protein JHW40_06140 [Paracoccus alcaliphilus]|uniref:hypothetical protein n=1 Tax=Paracoccus alcaliphilus TaxID=34002 RepID=UPI00147E7C26|nr:hypothetical protein [Paracoccus alcaliphilus]WCR19257.1 hypothetical protein JHW40_06140 [Paracoccus alcaliphilus]